MKSPPHTHTHTISFTQPLVSGHEVPGGAPGFGPGEERQPDYEDVTTHEKDPVSGEGIPESTVSGTRARV